MAIRAAGMNPTDALPRIRKPRHLMRKLVLLFLLTAAYALCLVMLFFKTSWFPLVLFSVFANATLAVVTGFGVRLLLSGRNWFIRSITAAFLPVVGLAILGYFSEWNIGIDVIALSLGYVSWEDLIHLVAGITAAWAALWAWHRPASREAANARVVEPVRSTTDVQPRRTRSPRKWSLRPGLRIGSDASLRPGNAGRPRVRARSLGGARQSTRPRTQRRFHVRRPHVQLALVEEHRCPYCLEPVLRTDSRGTKECEVCHTLHHADCWAITGTCQVPHLNS